MTYDTKAILTAAHRAYESRAQMIRDMAEATIARAKKSRATRAVVFPSVAESLKSFWSLCLRTAWQNAKTAVEMANRTAVDDLRAAAAAYEEAAERGYSSVRINAARDAFLSQVAA
jgi:hypothetical protein